MTARKRRWRRFRCAPIARAIIADPANRRFHAEPIACPQCGPRLSHPTDEIVAALRAGEIVALKGIGGFHLLCDARNEERGRASCAARKNRDAKPFAVMVANAASVARFAQPDADELRLLRSPARPIVLVESRSNLLAPSSRRTCRGSA